MNKAVGEREYESNSRDEVEAQQRNTVFVGPIGTVEDQDIVIVLENLYQLWVSEKQRFKSAIVLATTGTVPKIEVFVA